MGLVEQKKAIIFGIANDKSIAYGIAKKLKEEGAHIGIAYGSENLEKRVFPIAKELDATFCTKCNVANSEEIDNVFDIAAEKFGSIDILVHSIAYAPEKDLKCKVVDVSQEGFRETLSISVYSLIAISNRAYKLMRNGGSIITMTYYGSNKVVINYNIMGVAKAALEATVRYLASDLGEKGIRVNAISAGPIRTLAASGIGGFKTLTTMFGEKAPVKGSITKEDVANAALFFASDLSNKITGDILYVDGGYNILGC
jgi:enoyl-[acyl-carrier protein] reductase I